MILFFLFSYKLAEYKLRSLVIRYVYFNNVSVIYYWSVVFVEEAGNIATNCRQVAGIAFYW